MTKNKWILEQDQYGCKLYLSDGTHKIPVNDEDYHGYTFNVIDGELELDITTYDYQVKVVNPDESVNLVDFDDGIDKVERILFLKELNASKIDLERFNLLKQISQKDVDRAFDLLGLISRGLDIKKDTLKKITEE